MSRTIATLLALLSIIVILSLAYFFTPSEAGPLGVLVFFTSLYAFLFCVFFHLVSFIRFMFLGKERNKKLDSYYSIVFAFGPILLLFIRAFGALNVWTIASSVIFVFLGCFLIKNRLNVVK